MKARTFYFYRLSDGRFTGSSFRGHPKYLAANTPEGCGTKTGVSDFRRQRVDLVTGELVASEPEPSEAEKRFAALAEIERLERQQLRPLRELAVNPNNTDASTRLAAIDEQIAELRRQL